MTDVSNEEGTPSITLHGAITLLWGIALVVLGWIVIAVLSNWLSDFLHAPIGIKDNPPEPGAMVQIAQALLLPVGVCFLVLWALRLLTREFTSKQIAIATGGFGLWCAAVWGLYAAFTHRPEARYFQFAWTVLVAGILLAVDAFAAYAFIRGWEREDSLKENCAALLIILSVIPAAAAFVGICIPRFDNLIGYAFPAGGMFTVGILMAEKVKPDAASSQPANPEL